MSETTARITVPSTVSMLDILGPTDRFARRIEELTDTQINGQGTHLSVAGDSDGVELAISMLSMLISSAERGKEPSLDAIEALASGRANSRNDQCGPLSLDDDILLTYRGKALRPKTAGQLRYVEAIRSSTITFATGPAGTGKTYLAMAMAVAALKRHDVGRIVLTRPVVEAGESLGYLPGTLQEKLDPYIRPLYDALFDMTDMEKANAMIEQGIIEIAPLAFMRGRTMNDAFVILDEAQNTTPEQMKMFLTRLGFGTKMVVTGDGTQRDLGGESGLESARRVLGDMEGISFVDLGRGDVVRHELVGRIVDAYEAAGITR